MSYEDAYGNPQGCIRLIIVLFSVVFIVLMLLLLTGCSSPQVVTQTSYRDYYHTDTVEQRDSVYRYRYIYIKGDTIHIHDSIDRWRVKERFVIEHIHDSIDRPVYIEKELNGFQRAAQNSGYILWALIVVAIVIGVARIVGKFYGL